MQCRAGGTVIVAIVMALLHAPSAFADANKQATALVKDGQRFAKDGEYTDAVAKFKQADALVRRAEHACLIALAYFRSGAVGQAELFYDRCTTAAAPSDPVPSWGPELERKIAAQLPRWVAVDIKVESHVAEATVRLTASAFASDEAFSPRTIYVMPGELDLIAVAKGIEPIAKSVKVVRGERRTEVVFNLTRGTATASGDDGASDGTQSKKPSDSIAGTSTDTATTANTATSVLGADLADTQNDQARRGSAAARGGSSAWTWIAFATSGLALASGVTFHLMALSSRADLQAATDANDPVGYAAHESTFEFRRNVTYASYGVSFVAAAIGTFLVTRSDKSESVRVSAELVPSGGVVVVQWSR